MPSDAMPLIHALQLMQDNSLLSFAEIHFPSEMFKLRCYVNIMDVLVLVLVVPSLVVRYFMSLNDLIFTFLNLYVFTQSTASIRSSQSVNAIVLV